MTPFFSPPFPSDQNICLESFSRLQELGSHDLVMGITIACLSILVN